MLPQSSLANGQVFHEAVYDLQLTHNMLAASAFTMFASHALGLLWLRFTWSIGSPLQIVVEGN